MRAQILKFGRFSEYKKQKAVRDNTKKLRVSMDEDMLYLGNESIPLTFIYHIDLQNHYLQLSYWDQRGLPVVRSLTTLPLFGFALGRRRRLSELETCLKTSIHAAKATMLLKGRLNVGEPTLGKAFSIA